MARTINYRFYALFCICSFIAINYLNHKRIEMCKKLLKNTDCGIRDIAHLAGFSSQNYLSQSFCKSCGMTAGNYRKLKKKRKEAM